jgi:membrane protease YdiL (CAAX protease family)
LNQNSNNEIKDGRKFFSKIGFSFLGLTVFTIICQVILGIVLISTNSTFLLNNNFQIILSSITTYIIPAPFFIYIMNKLEKSKIEKHRMTIFKFLGCVAIAYALTFIGNLIGLTLTDFISNIIGSQIVNPIAQVIDSTNVWVTLLVMVILAPIFEELFFRKLLIDRTIKYGGLISILVSATLFALYHGNLNQFFYAFFLGGFFSFVYIKTGRIEYTIALHGIVNFIGSIAGNFILSLSTSSPDITTIFSIILFAIIITGFILILLNLNKINLNKGEIILKKSAVFLNIGMICFMVFYILTILSSVFMTL